MPDDLTVQIDRCVSAVRVGLPLLIIDGVEGPE